MSESRIETTPQPPPSSGLGTRLSRARQLYGFAVALVGTPLLTLLILPGRDSLGLDTALLLYILVSVTASAVGGVWPALAASLISFGLANYFFAPPYGSLLLENSNELIDLVVFLAVAAAVGVATELGARVRARAERNRFEADWLADLNTRDDSPQSVQLALAEASRLYEAHSVRLLEAGRELVRAGTPEPEDAFLRVPAGEHLELELSGPAQVGADRGLLATLALTAGRLWRTQQLAEQARRAEELSRIDELRASLLAAVGHDLRNPLAAISAAATTLGQGDIELSAEDRRELLTDIEDGTARLDSIISNLLDASRLRAGVLSVHIEPTNLLEALTPAIRLGEDRARLEIPEDLPQVAADAGLLERVFANVLDNADRHLAAGEQVLIRAQRTDDRVVVAVIDHGPGVAPERLAEIFVPFQHFGDRVTSGIGLGLAIAKGFTEAMGGTLAAAVTPGGGLTITLSLEAAGATPADR